MVQFLNLSGKEDNIIGDNIIVNTLAAPNSLDEYEINIISLSDKYLWRNTSSTKEKINYTNHFNSLKTMIKNSKNTKIVINLPQNETFFYHYIANTYASKCELKDMLIYLDQNILPELIDDKFFHLTYENTRTKVRKYDVNAAFYFNSIKYNSLTESVGSKKITTIGKDRIILTTLNLRTNDEINEFLIHIGLLNKNIEIPEWINNITMFNDAELHKKINENIEIIQKSNDEINESNLLLDRNNEYKSILFTTGDELVRVVFNILTEMLCCDLSAFVDEKKEDFVFSINDKVYIGEIKGVNNNIKSENVSQLDVHYQGYLDDHKDIESKSVKALLIMNHQKNKPLDQRQSVHETQIKLAQRNESLIIETITLLKMFEKFKNNNLTRDECIELLSNNTGILEIE